MAICERDRRIVTIASLLRRVGSRHSCGPNGGPTPSISSRSRLIAIGATSRIINCRQSLVMQLHFIGCGSRSTAGPGNGLCAFVNLTCAACQQKASQYHMMSRRSHGAMSRFIPVAKRSKQAEITGLRCRLNKVTKYAGRFSNHNTRCCRRSSGCHWVPWPLQTGSGALYYPRISTGNLVVARVSASYAEFVSLLEDSTPSLAHCPPQAHLELAIRIFHSRRGCPRTRPARPQHHLSQTPGAGPCRTGFESFRASFSLLRPRAFGVRHTGFRKINDLRAITSPWKPESCNANPWGNRERTPDIRDCPRAFVSG